MTSAPLLPKRLDVPDLAKGIGIILVVYGHVARGVVNAGLSLPPALFETVDRSIYSFHMSLFFFLSGLVVFFSHHKDPSPWKSLAKRLWTLFYLYVLWSLFEGGLGILLYNYATHGQTWEALGNILWAPIDHFWFLHTLFLVSLVSSALFHHATRLRLLGIAMGLTILYLFAPKLFLLKHLLFYTFGACFSFALPRLERFRGSPASIGAFILSLAAFLSFSPWIATPSTNDFHLSLLALPVFGIAASITLSVSIKNGGARWLALLGEHSLPIYLAHVLFAAGFRIVLRDAIHIEEPYIHLVGGFFVGLIGPLVLFTLLRKTIGRYLFAAPKLRI